MTSYRASVGKIGLLSPGMYLQVESMLGMLPQIRRGNDGIGDYS